LGSFEGEVDLNPGTTTHDPGIHRC